METNGQGDQFMALGETFGKLENLLQSLAKDLLKATRGNKSAAQRVRVGTIKLEKVGKLFRKESVDAERKEKTRKRKTKKRKKYKAA